MLSHRGPDDEGFFSKGNFGMGVRRLSIIDIPGGHQPIHNEDETIWVVCNGEIYNFIELREHLLHKGHRFYTKSDTEILVHLYEEYGDDFVDRLNGMFAFAIFDTKERKVFIVRDRIGIKPLYYYEENGLFIFGSELKAILGHPHVKKEINVQSLSNFLSLNYVPAPDSIFKNLKQLPAGFSITVTDTGTRCRQYWDLKYSGYFVAKEDALVEQLRAMLYASVKRHLISDVEVGAFLSGGLDSSSLVAIITKVLNRPIKTFCVGFSEKQFDESEKARTLSDYLRTEHHEIFCRPKDLIAYLPKMVWHADSLLADPAMLPLYLVSKLAKSRVSVALSGDGSDEIFAGYPTYLANSCRNYYMSIPRFLRKKVITHFVNSMPASTKKLGFDYTAKKFVEGAEFSKEKAHYWWRSIFSDKEKKNLLSGEVAALLKDADSFDVYKRYFDKINFPSFPSKCLYSDLKVWLPDNNLTRVDAITMACSLEARVPFLDHEIVEFVARIPFNLKYNRLQPKYILRETMRKLLPTDILKFKKSPWHVPLSSWFKTELREYVRSSLLDSSVIDRFFDRTQVRLLIEDHLRGRQNNSFKIWGLLVFSHWCEVFKPTDIS